MPSVSENQKTLACIALAIKTGKTKSSYSAEGAKMAETMSEQQLRDMCEKPVKK